jgi:hypothetical protein
MCTASRVLATIAGLLFATAAPSAWCNGLSTNPDNVVWPRWQGRISLGSSLPSALPGVVGHETAGLKVESVSFLGDYYFGRSQVFPSRAGGFRTTGGLLYGPRSQMTGSRPWISGQSVGLNVDRHLIGQAEHAPGDLGNDTATLPYLGFGYTGLSVKGGWSINADVGILSLAPGNSVKLGKVVGGTQSVDDLLRDLRLAPILRLGVSYSF